MTRPVEERDVAFTLRRMRRRADVTDAYASLLEADPALARAFGPGAAAELGQEPILPVLTVPAGTWARPERSALGAGAVALVVLDGLLTTGASDVVVGPGDVIDLWDRGGRWTAGTPLRLAVIGTVFMEATSAWPAVAARLLARTRRRPPGGAAGGSVDERLLAFLWQIAGRWGVPADDAHALPRALDAPAVAALLQLPDPQVSATLGRLVARGSVVRGDPRGWLMHSPTTRPAAGGLSRERRDDLRARGAQQLALARAIQAEYASLARLRQRA